MWISFNNFSIEVKKSTDSLLNTASKRQTIKTIQLLNAYTVTLTDFIFISAVLRHFLNKNEVNEQVMFKNTTEERKIDDTNKPLLFFTEKYALSFKSVSHSNKRYLIISTLGRYFYADYDFNVEKYRERAEQFKEYTNKDKEVDFTPQTKQITSFTAQFWLEALNKFPISV